MSDSTALSCIVRWRGRCSELSAADRRALFDRSLNADDAIRQRTADIVHRVRAEGDDALRAMAVDFDGVSLDSLEVPRATWQRALDALEPALRRSMERSASNIARVHESFAPVTQEAESEPGILIGRRPDPLARVGVYAPGGRAAYPSSVLMGAVPARVAGVGEIILCSPPDRTTGRPADVVLAAAALAGVDRVFALGGAGAIAAMAFGTASVPRVDKIVGPGNRFVAAAKSLVAADCAIDFYAGPTEIVIVSDRGNPEWIAADLIAQAEHDPQARAILITSSARLAAGVARFVGDRMPANGPARESLTRHGGIIVTRSAQESVELANRAAAEHLVCDDEKTAAAISCAGAVFVGQYTAQVAGDYAIGSNHVLPTNGAARFRGGLHAADFVRVSTVQRMTAAGLRTLAPTVITLARQEGLEGHAQSIEVRLK